MPRSQHLRKDKYAASAPTTARHMADAVEFLTRVANDAGLRRIAVKLARIRINLLTVAAVETTCQDRRGRPAADARGKRND